MQQTKSKKDVLTSAYRWLKPVGSVLIVEWEPQGSPFGPAVETRLSEEEAAEILVKAGFKPGRKISTDPYHYAVTYTK